MLVCVGLSGSICWFVLGLVSVHVGCVLPPSGGGFMCVVGCVLVCVLCVTCLKNSISWWVQVCSRMYVSVCTVC